MLRARDNPFAVERLHSLRYRFGNDNWDSLLNRLRQLRGRAAIVGPHGTGKSTLLHELADRLRDRGARVHRLFLNSENRAYPSDFVRRVRNVLGSEDVILLDGCEQMWLPSWLRFRWETRHAGCLIVTTHRHGRLPTLIECRTNRELFRELVGRLLDLDAQPPQLLEQLFEKHRGNMREAFRELYDQADQIRENLRFGIGNADSADFAEMATDSLSVVGFRQ